MDLFKEMDFVVVFMLGFLLILIILILFNGINLYNSNKFCEIHGFKNGYSEGQSLNPNPNIIYCYNTCFSSDKGTHRCNETYFKYRG